MRKRGKKFTAARAQIAGDRTYTIEEAMPLVQKVKYAKFDETVELTLRLGVDPKHADQMVRGTVVLPHGLGRTKRVLAIAGGEKQKEAREAGADIVGGEELVEKINAGWTDFDAVVATPDMMRAVGRLGKVLGPRGLMPNPKTGTVSVDIAKAVREIKAGKATPAPPVGTALGPQGVNIMDFCKNFNAKTAKDEGLIIPVVVTVYADRS